MVAPRLPRRMRQEPMGLKPRGGAEVEKWQRSHNRSAPTHLRVLLLVGREGGGEDTQSTHRPHPCTPERQGSPQRTILQPPAEKHPAHTLTQPLPSACPGHVTTDQSDGSDPLPPLHYYFMLLLVCPGNSVQTTRHRWSCCGAAIGPPPDHVCQR